MSDFFYQLYADAHRETRSGTMGRRMNEELVEIIHDCEASCEEMTIHITSMPDFGSRMRQASLLRECADICNLTAKALARNAVTKMQTTDLCATVCRECGTECAKYPDPMSQHCSKICLHCAKECMDYTSR